MAITLKLLAFAGSTRAESYNKKLVKIAVAGAQAAGAEVTYLNLRHIPCRYLMKTWKLKKVFILMHVMLKDIMLAHLGLLIASPEYNSSISGVLKNAIDWVSRSDPGEAPLACFVNKVTALMSAIKMGIDLPMQANYC